MPVCFHCNREIDPNPTKADSGAEAGSSCPHCGALLALDEEGLAGRHTVDLIPNDAAGSSGDNVLDDMELTLDDEGTLPFGQTVEFDPPATSDADDAAESAADSNNDSTIDHIDIRHLEDISTAPSDESTGAGDATVDLAVPVEEENAKDDGSATVDYIGDATVEFDAPTGTTTGDGGTTLDFDSDKTVDLSSVNPELAAKLSSQWAGTFELSTPQHQTIQQKDTDKGYRSTLPVKSRTLGNPESSGRNEHVRPTDAPDYQLLKMIGEGGMGVVYAARQSSIARTVAVKMLKPTAKVGADQRDKFISEAVVTGELDHPNIVPIYDLGSNEQGALFYSMKHVLGTPWDEVIAEKSLDENLNILLRVADAVAFAHARGVVHRDLKPENVMLGEFGEVLVMDWGLARVTTQFPNADAIYQASSLGGTPAYMSPEMARGPVESINHTSDVYLLGAMLYEVIGGRPPHSGGDVMKCLMRAAQNVIDPIDYRGELLDVAMKAMCTDQANRYPSVKEFQIAVRTYLSHSESLVLTAHAEHHLADARLQGDYKLFARALYGFQESLALWPDNVKAQSLLLETELDYARSALANADLDLAESLLDDTTQEHGEVLGEVRQAQRDRTRRQSLFTWTKRAVAALLLAIVGLGAYSYNEIAKGRREALTQRDRAQEQEGIAIANAKLAAENEAEATANAKEAAENANEAQQQRDEANQQRDEAQRQKNIADQNRQEAVENAEAARLAKEAAIAARDREEYEAYIAGIGLAAAKIDENAYDFSLQLLNNAAVDRRHWEWGRLRYLCQLSEAVYDNGASIDAVAYSPDGTLLATGDRNGKLTVRKAATGEVVFAVDHGQYVYAVAFSPDGRFVATGSSDGIARVVNASDGQVRRTLAGHDDGVLDVAFSPDGRQLVSSSYDNTARVWDLSRGETIATLAGHNWWVWSAQFSPDATQVVTASQDRSAIVWQRSADGTFEPVAQFTDHGGPVYAATFSPDGKQVATGSYDRTIRIWQPTQVGKLDVALRLDGNTQSNSMALVLTGHTGAVRSVRYAPDSPTLLSGSHDNTLRLWNITSGVEIKTLRGHGSRVEAVALSPNGDLAASGSQDGDVRVWDVAGYAESRVLGSRTLAGHADAVLAARFAADGRVLTASRDRTAKLWDASLATELGRFSEGHEFLATNAAFFDNGQRLVTGAGDNTARVWDVGTGAQLQVLRGTGRNGTIAVDLAGRWLATGGSNNTAQLWNLATGERLATLTGHEAEVTTATFTHDGTLLATGDDRGAIRLWQVNDGGATFVAKLTGHSRSITAVEFDTSGTRLYSSSGDNTCTQWDVATATEITGRNLKHPNWVASLDISADSTRAITACEDGRVRVWDLASASVIAEASFDSGSATGVGFSPDGTQAVVTSAENRGVWVWNWQETPQAKVDQLQPLVTTNTAGSLWTARYAPDGLHVLTVGGNDARLVDTATGSQSVQYSPHGAVAAVAMSVDGRLVATGSWDGTAKLWNATTRKVVQQLSGGHTGYINSIDFSPDGQLIATASDDGTARLWHAATGQPAGQPLAGHVGSVRSVRFSPSGDQLLTTGSDRTAKLWNANTGTMVRSFAGHKWGILSGVFSHDGNHVATASEDNTARVWNTTTGELVVTLSGHTSSVTGVAFTPDGARLLTGSQDTTAKLWDTTTGQEILTLAGHTQDLTSVDFSPDGRTALTASRDGTAILWPTVDWREPGAAMMAGAN